MRSANTFAKFWPIEKITSLPPMRGVYILYDKDKVPFYCFRSSKVQNRIYLDKVERYYRRKTKYFSAYNQDTEKQQQIETIILHTMQQILRLN